MPFSNFTNFKSLPSDSIITFQLPLTFQLPPNTTQDIYQPSYVLSSTYTKTTDANPSWVLMNNLGQFNPLVSWQIPPYKQGSSVGTYPSGVGIVGVLGVNKTGSYPVNTYTLSIKKSDGTALVSSASLFFRFTQNSTQDAYTNGGNTLVTNGLSYIKMPVFTPTKASAISAFESTFQSILNLFKNNK